MNLYLDIDGVLLDTKHQKVPDGGKEFIEFAVSNFSCHWLTTHCQGDSRRAIDYLSNYYSSRTIELLKTIQPTKWNTLKTEAIDFTQPFVWLDDYVFQSEMDILHENRTEDSLILVNLDSPNELRNLMVSLQV